MASANCRLVAHLPRTAFKPGQSGNPRGRRPGTQNKRTIEAREFATRLINDDEYREALRWRMISGTAGAMEAVIWAYAKGKPVDRVELGGPGAFAQLTDAELRDRMIVALDSLL
jgi:hypothetical protein